MLALCLADVTKRVQDGGGRRAVLSGVCLSLEAGEVAVVRGPSGSGKTTLLAVAGGMLVPTSGEVTLGGEAISRLRDRHRSELRRRCVGFVFQDVQLIDTMTARQNVLLPAVPEGRDFGERARTLMERFGVAQLSEVLAGKLSGGERQRVALARALLLDPAVLVLDEPTAHIDDVRAEQLLAELASLAASGKALLIATHDPRLVLAGARVFRLEHGELTEG